MRVAPASPKFTWQVDVLAAVVNDLRGDTADLIAFADAKNAWEDAQEGRAAKAAAALALYQERQKAKLAAAEALEGGEGGAASVSASVPDAVVELLATALEKEVDELRARELVLARAQQVRLVPSLYALCPACLPACQVACLSALFCWPSSHNPPTHPPTCPPTTQYKEFVDLQPDTPPVLAVDPESLEAGRAARAERTRQSEELAKAQAARFTAFGEETRAVTALRVQALLDGALDDAKQIAELWQLRENYAKFATSQNENLRWILDRTKAAIDKCIVEEDPAAAAAAAKGAKKK